MCSALDSRLKSMKGFFFTGLVGLIGEDWLIRTGTACIIYRKTMPLFSTFHLFYCIKKRTDGRFFCILIWKLYYLIKFSLWCLSKSCEEENWEIDNWWWVEKKYDTHLDWIGIMAENYTVGATGCVRKKVPYSSGLVWTSSSYSSSSSSSYSSSLKKKRKRKYQPLCPSVEAYSLYSSSLLESYLSHDQHHQHVSSKTSLKPLFCLRKMCGYEKNKRRCVLFVNNPLFGLFFYKQTASVCCYSRILGYILGSVDEKGNMKRES